MNVLLHMYTCLLLFMLVTNCQCLSPAWLLFVLSFAANYSNIFQSNEVPYVPEFLSLHSELQTLVYDFRTSMDRTSTSSHAQWFSISEFYNYKLVTGNFLCLISRVQAETYRAKGQKWKGFHNWNISLENPSSLPLLSLIISVIHSLQNQVSAYISKKTDNAPWRFFKNNRG